MDIVHDTAPRHEPRNAEPPLVSVIIATYNDAAHLAAAIRSTLDQTLRSIEVIVADDHSTDETPQLVARFAAADRRVHSIRLEANSGGAGAPRNAGIERASGSYIMFLDSDDVLERHAAKNLFLAAERAGADIACGKTVRFEIESGGTESWYGHLYDEPYQFDTIDDVPLFVHDTLITNKLFRADFLRDNRLRFPEDMHYEDVVFAAEAYAAARGFTVIPEKVYQWNVYPTEVRQSITNQRSFLKNLHDRIRSVHLTGRAMAGRSEEVLHQLDQKLLRHHLRLYLNDALAADDPTAKKILEIVAQEAKSAQRAAFLDLPLPLRLLYASCIAEDLDAVRECLYALARNAMPGEIAQHNGHWNWIPSSKGRPLAIPEDFSWLAELDGDPYLQTPHGQLDYLHTAVAVRRVSSSQIEVDGVSLDPLSKIRDESASATLICRTVFGRIFNQYPLTLRADGGRLAWSTIIDAPRRSSLQERDGRFYTVVIELQDGARSERPLYFDDPSLVQFSDTSLVGRINGDTWTFTSRPEQPAEMQITGSGALGTALRTALSATTGVKQFLTEGSRAVRGLTSDSSRFGLGVFYPLLRKLPLKSDQVFFESHLGLAANDSPRAVFEQLRVQDPSLRTVWSLAGHADGSAAPEGATVVRRGSRAYLSALARSRYLVDNQSLPEYFTKRTGQRYLQTWHGIPLKTIGKDEPRFSSPADAKHLESVSSLWDGLNVPCPYFEQTFVPAYGYRGSLLRYGSPRNDILFAADDTAERVRHKLDLPDDTRLILYAPTFRENLRSKTRAAQLPLDLKTWSDEIGIDTVLLVRAHYLNRFSIPESMRSRVIDVSDYPEIGELYLVADALITDYSSAMFDYALLRRPIVIFAPDYEQYVEHGRGTYFDLREHAPGPFVEEMADLPAALLAALRAPIPDAHEQFIESYCGREDGAASVRSVEFLLGVER